LHKTTLLFYLLSVQILLIIIECADITFLANKTFWTAGFSSAKPENFSWCSTSTEDVDFSKINWMKGQPQYKANGCLGVFFPFINRTIGKQIAPPPSIPRFYNYLLVP
jgi:hypothetical protein